MPYDLTCSHCDGRGEYTLPGSDHEATCAKCYGSGLEGAGLPPMPKRDQLPELFHQAHICPTRADRDRHREMALYHHYRLDWRQPVHKAWVADVIAIHGEGDRVIRYETND